MIRYALVCSGEHEFDGWFRSAADFETQAERGLITCALCGTTEVQRGLMAPNVLTARSRGSKDPDGDAGDRQAEAATPAAVVGTEPMPAVVAPDPQQKAMLEALAELKRRITASADYVGERFAEEARKMHYGEAPERGIYGETTGEEARALFDEGIEIHPLPMLPDDRN